MPTTYKTITGYSGKYLIGDNGTVVSLLKTCSKWRKPSVDKLGYHRIVLCYEGKNETRYVHRLVAEAFVPGNHSLTVNHKDLNKQNNCVENLEWVTQGDNVRHARKLKAWNMNDAAIKRVSKAVVGVSRSGEEREFKSINGAARALQSDAGGISHAIRNGKYHAGHRWSFNK